MQPVFLAARRALGYHGIPMKPADRRSGLRPSTADRRSSRTSCDAAVELRAPAAPGRYALVYDLFSRGRLVRGARGTTGDGSEDVR